VTDAGGKFTFSLAEPISVFVQVTRTGYLPGTGQASGNSSSGIDFSKPIEVKLVPTSVVEGRVLGSDGEPLAGMNVEVTRAQIEDGRKVFRRVSAGPTNDLGEYRFWNISPGSVYVRVAGRAGTYSGIGTATRPPGASVAYPAVYFPGVAERQSATAILLPPGQTVHADFSLEPQKAFAIRGTIRNPSAYLRLGVRLLTGDQSIANRTAVNTATGAFQIFDVTPGHYTVQGFSNGAASLALAEVPATVKDQDVSGIDLSLSSGVVVKGTIQHSEPQPLLQPFNDDPCGGVIPQKQRRMAVPPVQAIILNPDRFPTTGTQPPAQVDEKGNFEFADMLPGKYAFNAFSGGEYIESIRSGSTDVIANDLEVGLASPEPLVITLGRGSGTIRGAVVGLQQGEAATVVLLRSGSPKGAPRTVRSFPRFDPQTGQRDSDPNTMEFVAASLAPGDYVIYAWPSSQQLEFRNPEVLRSLSGSAAAVSLHENGQEQVKVNVVSALVQ
jgi:hypothetical protein